MSEPYNIAPRVSKAFGHSARRKSDIAALAGIRWAQFQKILNGQRPQVSADTVRRLAQALHVSTDFLLGLTDDPTPHWTRQESPSCPPLTVTPPPAPCYAGRIHEERG